MILFLVTGAGAGYCPRMPGTIGTLMAIPLSVALNRIASTSLPLAFLLWLASVASAIALSTKGAEILGQKDPARIVVDEMAGFLTASFCAPPGIVPLALAFVLFRLFDIVKVYPASALEKLPGGTGIVLDDVAAGFYTLGIIQLLSFGGML